MTTGMELLSQQEEPLGLSKDNVRRVKKRTGGPKWVRKLSKMVETMAKNIAKEVPMGVIAQEIWDIILELDKDDRRLLKDDAEKIRGNVNEKRKRKRRRKQRKGQKDNRNAKKMRAERSPKFSIKTEVLGGGAVAEAETEADPPPPPCTVQLMLFC